PLARSPQKPGVAGGRSEISSSSAGTAAQKPIRDSLGLRAPLRRQLLSVVARVLQEARLHAPESGKTARSPLGRRQDAERGRPFHSSFTHFLYPALLRQADLDRRGFRQCAPRPDPGDATTDGHRTEGREQAELWY